MSNNAIVKLFPARKLTINKIRDKLGISRYEIPTSHFHTDAIKKHLLENPTITNNSICKMFGINIRLAARIRTKFNIPTYQKACQNLIEQFLIENPTMSTISIAEKFKVSATSIKRYRRKLCIVSLKRK